MITHEIRDIILSQIHNQAMIAFQQYMNDTNTGTWDWTAFRAGYQNASILALEGIFGPGTFTP